MAINNSSAFDIFEKFMKAERCTDVIFKLTLYCLSLTVEDLNLQWKDACEDMNILGKYYFVVLNSTLGAC